MDKPSPLPSKPITFQEAKEKYVKQIPDEVINCFNEAIVDNLCGHSATVKVSDVAARMRKAFGESKEFESRWLWDIEDVYRKAGWTVNYDAPGHNESYPATFTFTK